MVRVAYNRFRLGTDNGYRKVARRRVHCIGGRWQIWRKWNRPVEGRWAKKSGAAESILYRKQRDTREEREESPSLVHACVLSQIQADLTELSEIQADCA